MRFGTLIVALAAATLTASSTHAQGPPDTASIKTAMQRLSFLAGNWTGEATVTLGPGKSMKITQTEEVVYKLDGLVMLIEGTGRDESGQVVFNALAIVSFDPRTKEYRIRAYRDGNSLDTELKLAQAGFEWGFNTGGVAVRNVMSVDEAGRWIETTEAKLGDGREFRMVEMKLTRK
jgi:hypothetical protein